MDAIVVSSFEEFKAKLEGSPEFAIGALVKLYNYQTEDEQVAGQTVYDNSMGFNGVDARILTSMAQQYKRKSRLSEKQIPIVVNKLQKYSRQLMGKEIIPMPIAEKEEPSIKYRVTLKGDDLMEIKFPYDKDMIPRIKSLSGRRWSKVNKLWTAPLEFDNLEALVGLGFELAGELEAIWNKWVKEVKVTISGIPGFKNFDLLRPYQREGIEWLERKGGRGVLGDDMGLGKTPQTLAYWMLHPEHDKTLVLCPASLKLNWQREFGKWTDEEAYVIMGKKGPIPDSYRNYICNYDIVWDRLDSLLAMGFKSIAMDEVHFLKNNKSKKVKNKAGKVIGREFTTKRVAAVAKLIEGVPSLIPLTGTPIKNRPIELFNILNWLDPARWPSFFGYAKEFCGARNNGFGWEFKGATNLTTLYEKLKFNMLRRMKSEVLKDLPPKIRSVVPMELDPKKFKVYEAAKADVVAWIKENVGEQEAMNAETEAKVLVEFSKLKQLSVDAKMKSMIKWIDEFLENPDNKLMLFGTSYDTIDAVCEHYGEAAVKLDGRDSQKSRWDSIDAFNSNPGTRVFVGNILAAGVGLSITGTNTVAFMELAWSPGDHDQAEDRAYGLGRGKEGYGSIAYYLMGSGTVEEEIATLIDHKRKVIDAVHDGKETEDTDLLMQLVKSYNQ